MVLSYGYVALRSLLRHAETVGQYARNVQVACRLAPLLGWSDPCGACGTALFMISTDATRAPAPACLVRLASFRISYCQAERTTESVGLVRSFGAKALKCEKFRSGGFRPTAQWLRSPVKADFKRFLVRHRAEGVHRAPPRGWAGAAAASSGSAALRSSGNPPKYAASQATASPIDSPGPGWCGSREAPSVR